MSERRTPRWVLGLLAVGVMGVLAAAAAEASVRWLKPTPRVQVVRGGEALTPDVRPIRMLHGEPTWDEVGSVPRRNLDCQRDDTIDVLMLGSSIFFGVSYEAEQVMSAALQRRLDAVEPGRWCVLNFGQPGYTSGPKLALAKEYIAKLQPEVVLWELWTNDPGGFTKIGDDAYNLTRLELDDEGYPLFRAWIPRSLHQLLFRSSRFWEYASLALTPTVRGDSQRVWGEFARDVLPTMVELTEEAGSAWSIVYTPPLNTSFEESAARSNKRMYGYAEVAKWADAQGVAQLDLAAALAGQDPKDLRHDPCCHYNVAGHEAVADALMPWVRRLAADRAARDAPTPTGEEP
jgi:hypothetical protein